MHKFAWFVARQGERSAAATLVRPTECAGDGRPAMLALNPQSGSFAVFCESGSTRKFRRFAADGTALDTTMQAVPNSQPDSFSFYYWGAAMNRAGAFMYFGRNSATQWIVRLYAEDAQITRSFELAGTAGLGSPRAELTSAGGYLIQLAGGQDQLTLIDAAGEITRTWPVAPSSYRLDAEDHVYVVLDNGIVRSSQVKLR